MGYNIESPLRVVITGIDGAGKSTTASRIAEQIGRTHRVVKPGPSRPVYTIIDGKKKYHFQRVTQTIDFLHALADRTEKPSIIGAVNAMNVLLNGRIIEPSLTHRFHPDLVLGARDFYIDPSVYSIAYCPSLAKKPPGERIDFLRTIIGAPFRDVVFFLTVPPEEAVNRIEGRIAIERQVGVSEREKWRHMHENPATLALLQENYYGVIRELRLRCPHMEVYEIDTSGIPQLIIVDFIKATILSRLERFCREGGWIKVGRDAITNG